MTSLHDCPTVEMERQFLSAIHNHPNQKAWNVSNETGIVGIAAIQNPSMFRGRHIGVIAISIKRVFRNQGIGSRLLKEMMAWAEQNLELERLELEVFADNQPAIHLYKKFGFLKEGRRKNAIKLDDGSYRDTLIGCAA